MYTYLPVHIHLCKHTTLSLFLVFSLSGSRLRSLSPLLCHTHAHLCVMFTCIHSLCIPHMCKHLCVMSIVFTHTHLIYLLYIFKMCVVAGADILVCTRARVRFNTHTHTHTHTLTHTHTHTCTRTHTHTHVNAGEMGRCRVHREGLSRGGFELERIR